MERKLELIKVGATFKDSTQFVFSLKRLLNIGSKELFSVIHVLLFIHYIFINREIIPTHNTTLSYLTQLCCGIILPLNVVVYHHF